MEQAVRMYRHCTADCIVTYLTANGLAVIMFVQIN
jgi:hypothetical protein